MLARNIDAPLVICKCAIGIAFDGPGERLQTLAKTTSMRNSRNVLASIVLASALCTWPDMGCAQD